MQKLRNKKWARRKITLNQTKLSQKKNTINEGKLKIV